MNAAQNLYRGWTVFFKTAANAGRHFTGLVDKNAAVFNDFPYKGRVYHAAFFL